MAAKQIGPIMAQVGADTKGFTDGLTKAQKSLQQFSSTAAIAGVRASAAFAASFGAIGAFALKVGSDFELAFANIRKTVDGSEEDFANLETVIRDTSKEFGIAATELADFARIGGQLGIKPDQLDEFTRSISRLSIAAAELDPENAAKALARLAALTGEGAGSIEKMANVVAKLGDSLPTTEDRILDFSVRMASFGSAVGLTSTQILGLAGGFSALVGGTERAATSVERFLGEMAIAVKDNGSELEAFADLAKASLGDAISSTEDFSNLFQEAPLEAIEAVIGGMEQLGAQGLAPLLAKFDELGIKGVRMLSTFAAGAKGADTLRMALATAAKEAQEQTKLNKELAIQLDTVSRQFDRLKTAVVDVGITLFQAFRDEIMFLISAGQVFVAGLAKIAGAIKAMGTVVQFGILGVVGLMGAFAALLVVVGTLGGLVTGVSALMTTLGTLLISTGIGAGAATTGLATYGVATATASASTTLFTTALGVAKVALVSFIAPALAVAAAFSAAFVITKSIAGAFRDMNDPINKAAAELGVLGSVVESVKIVGGTFIGFVSEAAQSTGLFSDTVSDLLQPMRDAEAAAKGTAEGIKETTEATKEAEGSWLRFLNPVTLLSESMIATREETRLAEDRIRTIAVASALAGEEFKTLGEAQAFLTQRQKEGIETSKQHAAALDAASQSGSHLTDNLNDTIAGLLRAGDAEQKVSDVAKELGLTVDELNAKMGTNREEFLRLAEAQIKSRDAADEYKKVMDGIRESINAFSLENTRSEFNNFATAVRETMQEGVALTDQGVVEMVTKLRELAKAAGVELPEDLKAFATAADEISTQLETKFKTEAAREELRLLGQEAAALDFASFQAGLIRALEEGEKFSSEQMIAILGKLEEGAKQSGEKALKELKGFISEAQREVAKTVLNIPIKMSTRDFKLDPNLGAGNVPFEERPPIMTQKEAMAAAEVKKQMEAINEEIKESDKETRKLQEAMRTLSSTMQVLGIDSDSAMGKLVGGFQAAALAGNQFKGSMLDMKGIMTEGGGFGALASKEGLSAGMEMGGSLVQGASAVWEATAGGGLKGAMGGALAGGKLGSEIGGMFGPIGSTAGAVIGAGIGVAISLFRGKPEFVKIMEDVGKEWGVEISEELAKKIEATADELNLDRLEATLLNIGDVIAEAGGVIEFGMDKAAEAVGDLMNGIVDGSLPAEQAIGQISQVFTEMAAETVKAGELADAQLLALVQRSRELGLEIPEIAQFISDQLAQAAEGISKIIGTMTEVDGKQVAGGIQIASVEDAEAQAKIFSAAFFATVSEEGLLAAVDAFGPAMDEMKAKLEAFGGEGINLSGLEKFFNMAQNPEFRPLLEGVEGLTQGLAGLGNAGFLTADTFGAFQQQGSAAFQQLQDAGLSSKEALQQMAPFLQEALNASQQFGFELDENTQSMIDQAEAAGIGFSTDPMMQVVDVLKLIAGELGVTGAALDGVGSSASEAGTAVDESLGGAAEGLGEKYDELGNRAEAAYNRASDGAEAAASSQTEAASKAAEETTRVTEEAAKQTELDWAATTEMVGADYDIMTDKILTDYGIVIEATSIAGAAVSGLGTDALIAASGFDQMAVAAQAAATAARAAKTASGNNGGDGGDGGPQGGQFGLTTTVNEPTTFIAGEAGEETVTIDPGGGGGQGAGPSVVVLQIDGKTIGKVLGDLSRTGDVRIHPSAVKDFG